MTTAARPARDTREEEPAPRGWEDVSPAAGPTIFHVTHWKAGSQWIYKILRQCAGRDQIVAPQIMNRQFLDEPVQAGKIYPTVYVTKEQFDSAELPKNWRRFVIIRDLRDTLISGYFSMKVSHPVTSPDVTAIRAQLESLSLADGLIYLMDGWLTASSQIQWSWLNAGEPLIRYEDLLDRDVEILQRTLLDECGLGVSRARLREVVRANRFACGTQGRLRGQEDVTQHMRKGIVGDWRNHFTEPVKRAFKTRFGELLIAAGYAADLNW